MEFVQHQNIDTLEMVEWFIDGEEVSQEEYTQKLQEKFEGASMYCNSSVTRDGSFYVHRCSIDYFG